MFAKVISLLVFQSILVVVSGHSWLDCINVVNPSNIISLANLQCNGYPANYVGRANPDANMYKVQGIDPAAWPSTPCCKSASRTYSAEYPMTVVQAGGTITLGYTPNGHTSWMSPPPPHGSQDFTVYWNPNRPGQTPMVTMNDMVNSPVLYSTLFETPCHDRNTGAQLDPSSGLCAAAITIPANTQPGVYQMVWYWPFRFQGPAIVEDYLTCFDVQVTAGSGVTTTSPTTTAPTTPAPTQTVPPTTTLSPTTTTSAPTNPLPTTTPSPTTSAPTNPLPTTTPSPTTTTLRPPTTISNPTTPGPNPTTTPGPNPTTTPGPNPTTTPGPNPTTTPGPNPTTTPGPNPTTVSPTATTTPSSTTNTASTTPRPTAATTAVPTTNSTTTKPKPVSTIPPDRISNNACGVSPSSTQIILFTIAFFCVLLF